MKSYNSSVGWGNADIDRSQAQPFLLGSTNKTTKYSKGIPLLRHFTLSPESKCHGSWQLWDWDKIVYLLSRVLEMTAPSPVTLALGDL